MQAQSYNTISSLHEGSGNVKEAKEDVFFYEDCESFNVSFMSEYEIQSPTLFTPDTPVLMEVTDQGKQTHPDPEVQRSSISDSTLGLSNQGEIVPLGAHSGPYQGELLNAEEAMNSPCSLVVSKSKPSKRLVDVRNKALVNWTRYENCALNEEEQNLVVFLYFGGILYRCILPIKPGQGLLLWHKEGHSSGFNITLDFLKKKKCPLKEMKETIVKLFSCSPCPLSYPSQFCLDTHTRRGRPEEYVGQQVSGQNEEEDDDSSNKNLKASESSSSQQISSRSLSHGPNQKEVHHRSTIKSYQCSESEKTPKHQTSSHQQQLVQTAEKPFSCSEDEKAFSQQSTIEEHRLIHREEKPFQCSECGKSFTKLYHLQQHKHSHVEEKPFYCQQCRKTYSDKASLRHHQRLHTGEKPYVCTQCDERFTYYNSLMHHKRLHTGMKSYPCSTCGKTFNRKRELKKHQRTHMGEKPF